MSAKQMVETIHGVMHTAVTRSPAAAAPPHRIQRPSADASTEWQRRGELVSHRWHAFEGGAGIFIPSSAN
jgi:hypothetical protein